MGIRILTGLIMSKQGDSGRSYHLKCTGEASQTAEAHSKEADLILFGSCFCPFVQRVWIAFEELGIDYRVSDANATPSPSSLRV